MPLREAGASARLPNELVDAAVLSSGSSTFALLHGLASSAARRVGPAGGAATRLPSRQLDTAAPTPQRRGTRREAATRDALTAGAGPDRWPNYDSRVATNRKELPGTGKGKRLLESFRNAHILVPR